MARREPRKTRSRAVPPTAPGDAVTSGVTGRKPPGFYADPPTDEEAEYPEEEEEVAAPQKGGEREGGGDD